MEKLKETQKEKEGDKIFNGSLFSTPISLTKSELVTLNSEIKVLQSILKHKEITDNTERANIISYSIKCSPESKIKIREYCIQHKLDTIGNYLVNATRVIIDFQNQQVIIT